MFARKLTTLRVLVHLGSLAPLAVLIRDFLNDNLTVNPIQEITFRTGKTALVMLILTLSCTALNTLFGFRLALKVRRSLGLYTFLYVGLHFLTFIGLDYGLDLTLIYEAIFEKRYALVGFAAFLILLPMAITSFRWWMKRLGQNWKRLHRLVYLAAGLVVVHYTWSVKSDYREPLAYGAVVALLLALRLPAVRRVASNLRNRLERGRGRRAGAAGAALQRGASGPLRVRRSVVSPVPAPPRTARRGRQAQANDAV